MLYLKLLHWYNVYVFYMLRFGVNGETLMGFISVLNEISLLQ